MAIFGRSLIFVTSSASGRRATHIAMNIERRLRKNSLARCARAFAAATVVPAQSATSVIDMPSTSRMTITARYLAGRSPIAAISAARSSDCTAGSWMLSDQSQIVSA